MISERSSNDDSLLRVRYMYVLLYMFPKSCHLMYTKPFIRFTTYFTASNLSSFGYEEYCSRGYDFAKSYMQVAVSPHQLMQK